MARIINIHRLADLQKLIDLNIINRNAHIVLYRRNVFYFVPRDPTKRHYIVALTFSNKEFEEGKKTYQFLQKSGWIMLKGTFKT